MINDLFVHGLLLENSYGLVYVIYDCPFVAQFMFALNDDSMYSSEFIQPHSLYQLIRSLAFPLLVRSSDRSFLRRQSSIVYCSSPVRVAIRDRSSLVYFVH